MIIPQARLIFVHIQKTGGESVSTALGASCASPDKHWTAAELARSCPPDIWESHTKFAFVRNPWDRLVSWWSMIDGRRAQFDAGVSMNNFMHYVLSNATSFDLFLQNCTAEIVDPDGRKCIYNDQTSYIVDANGASLVDFVGRFETMETDLSRLMQMTDNDPVDLPHLNASRRQPYQEYYTAELAELVGRAYARDIRAFGYTF